MHARADQRAQEVCRHVRRRVMPVRYRRRHGLEDVHDVVGDAGLVGHDHQARRRVPQIEETATALRAVEQRLDTRRDIDDLLGRAGLELDDGGYRRWHVFSFHRGR